MQQRPMMPMQHQPMQQRPMMPMQPMQQRPMQQRPMMPMQQQSMQQQPMQQQPMQPQRPINLQQPVQQRPMMQQQRPMNPMMQRPMTAACIGYIIFISENVSQVLCTDSRNPMCPSKNKVAFLTVLCLAPFTFLRSMKTLEIPTLLANVALLGGIMWGYKSAFVGLGRGPDLVPFNLFGLPIFFGMAVA